MPILVKDYRWSETEENIFLNVPLKGVKGNKADILCTQEFIKVSYPPFLFEALLFDSIDDDKSRAKIRDGCITFTLPKQEQKMWSQLLSIHADDKSFILKKKQEAIEYSQKKSEKMLTEKSTIKEKNKKYALKEMMKLEEDDRCRIEGIKESERTRTMNEFAQWKDQKRNEAEREKIELLEHYKAMKLLENEEETCKITEIFDDEDDYSCNVQETVDENEVETPHETTELKHKNVKNENERSSIKSTKSQNETSASKSGPRSTGKISVNFTPRVFPTPQRESKQVEENEWLQKQAESRKLHEIDDPDLAEHEKDPIWLKDKGGQLFASGNYLAAVNAYNLAIKIQPRMPVLFLNRATCHLKLRNLYKCAEDSSTALDLMIPKVDANAKGRLKAHLRRAVAFCELELYVEALQDYEAALKIEPKNQNLIEDAQKIRTVIQSSTG